MKLRSYLQRALKKTSRPAITLPAAIEPAPGRHGIAVVAIVKDEAEDLEEWVRFHLMMGVRAVFIYDNGSTDGTRELAAGLGRELPVTVIPWVGFLDEPNPQMLAYAHALMNFGGDFRWMTFIDIDEFVFPVTADTLTEALADFDDLPSISLPWHMFGASGHKARPDGLVIENYTMRAPFPPDLPQIKLLAYKVIVDPVRVVASGTHSFGLDKFGWVSFNDRRERFTTQQHGDPAFASAGHIRLNHYFTKSEADFEAKIRRGRITRSGKVSPRTALQRKAMIEESPVEDRAILRFADRLRDAMMNGKTRASG